MPTEEAAPALRGCRDGEKTLPAEDALLSARRDALQRICVAMGMSQEAAVIKALGINELLCKCPVGRGPTCSCAADKGTQLIPVIQLCTSSSLHMEGPSRALCGPVYRD